MKTILWDLTQHLSFRDVFLPAIAGRSAGPESIAPAVVMDSGLAYPALRASHAPRNDDGSELGHQEFRNPLGHGKNGGGRLAHARALHRITGILRSTEAANPAFTYQHCIGLSGQKIAERWLISPQS